MELYDIDICDADDDDAYLGTVESIQAPDREAAMNDPQVLQYVEGLRDDYPNAMPRRVVLHA